MLLVTLLSDMLACVRMCTLNPEWHFESKQMPAESHMLLTLKYTTSALAMKMNVAGFCQPLWFSLLE